MGVYYGSTSTPSIVTNGLILNLDAGNTSSYPGSGTLWSDLSGNSYNATLINGVTFDSQNSGVLVFDGVNDYAQVSHNNSLNATLNMTISCWVQINSFVTNMSITGKGSVTSGQGGFDFRIDDSQTLNLVKYFVADQKINVPQLLLSTWYNICAVQSSSEVKYYINGKNVGSFTNLSSYQTNTNNLFIGKDRDIIYSPIKISNIMMYNRTLTDKEISRNYFSMYSRFYS